MRIHIIDGLARKSTMNVYQVPSVGDFIDLSFSGLCKVKKIVWYPSEERLNKLDIRDATASALIFVEKI